MQDSDNPATPVIEQSSPKPLPTKELKRYVDETGKLPGMDISATLFYAK